MTFFLVLCPISGEEAWRASDDSRVSAVVSAKLENITIEFGCPELLSAEISDNGKDPVRFTGVFEVRIFSLKTGNDRRDHHLLSPEFFNAALFPEATISISRVAPLEGTLPAGENYKAYSTVTIKGKEEFMIIPFKLDRGGGVLKASGSFRIDRRKFQLSGNTLANIITSNFVTINFDVSLLK